MMDDFVACASSQDAGDVFVVFSDQTFSTQLQREMYEMREEGAMTDFEVKVGEVSIPCHKLVLAASCPFFRVMFRSGLDEVQKKEVDLNCLDEEVVKSLIRYLYTGEIQLRWNKMDKLVEASDYLQVKTLKDKSEKLMVKKVNSHSCIKWYKLARLYSMNILREQCKKLMCKDFVEVADSVDFKEMNLEELIEIVKDKNIEVSSENPVLNACIEWAMYDLDNRKESFIEVLKSLFLEFCTSDYLDHVLEKYEQLMDLPNVQATLFKAYRKLNQGGVSIDTHLPRKSFKRPGEYIAVVPRSRGRYKKCMFWVGDGWHLLTDIPKDKSPKQASICEVKDGFLITGGVGSGGTGTMSSDYPIRSVYMYNITGHMWRNMTMMTDSRSRHASFAIGNLVYVFGGTVGSKTTEVFDLETNHWEYRDPLVHNLHWPLVARLHMNLYAILHDDDRNAYTKSHYGVSLQIYDSVKDKWRIGAALPENENKTDGACAIGFKNAVYVIGGEGNLCNRYNTDTDTWTSLLKQRKFNFQWAPAVIVSPQNNRILVMGGCIEVDNDEDQYLEDTTQTVMEFDPASACWSESTIFCPAPISDHCAMHITVR